jgi:anaerobic magnesium-protoporphyrin IX monomethyl ester cyclase
MQVLLLAMPDSFEHMATVAIRMPNGALTSLAGNVDAHHSVAVADLVLVQSQVRAVVERLVRERAPDVVGLSVMTFQRHTAQRLIELVRALRPGVRIVVGGYDPSLAPEAYTRPGPGAADFIVRGVGELTVRALVRALERGGGFAGIPGLTFRAGDLFVDNPARPVSGLEDGAIALPNRAARVLRGYTMVGRQVDVVETSRGCTFDCSFCSIIEMRGRNFHTYDFERVLADIRDARAHGARSIFIVDDNITLDVRRFEALCRAIVDAGLSDLEYLVQAMTSAIANHGLTWHR